MVWEVVELVFREWKLSGVGILEPLLLENEVGCVVCLGCELAVEPGLAALSVVTPYM